MKKIAEIDVNAKNDKVQSNLIEVKKWFILYLVVVK
jgi:hypothetical protein